MGFFYSVHYFLSRRTSVDGPQSRRQDPQQAEDPQPRRRRQDQAGDPESQTLQTPTHHQVVSDERRRRTPSDRGVQSDDSAHFNGRL